MSDYYSEPHIETPNEVLPPPESHSGTPGKSPGAKEAIQQIQDEIFDKLGNADGMDATDWIEERKDREADEKGQELSPERNRARLDRYQKALEAAGDDYTREASARLTGEQEQDHNFDLQRRDNAVKAITKHEMRVEEFQKSHPDYREVIQSTFSLVPLADHVAEAFIQSPLGPEAAYLLAQNPDQIDEFNRMSPDELRLSFARAEGAREAQLANQRNAPPARRATKAPPPMRQIRGGSASPSFDASTASMEEYAARRKAGWRG